VGRGRWRRSGRGIDGYRGRGYGNGAGSDGNLDPPPEPDGDPKPELHRASTQQLMHGLSAHPAVGVGAAYAEHS
jgi:hypothetical protein